MDASRDFVPGKAIHLKNGAFPSVKIRDWVIQEILPNEHFLLCCTKKNYTLEVLKEDIELGNFPKK